MRSAPLFIDAGDDTVATVVSMPDGPPEGLVVVLAGIGRHVVIGGTLAALLAEPLASEGLATLRVDYAGVGDSPGVVSSWTAADVSREAAATSRAVSTVREALGVDRFVSVGTCFGSRVALRLVSDPAWGGTVCLAPPILDPGSPALARRALGRRRVVETVRSLPFADTLLKPVAKRLVRRGPSSSVIEALSHLAAEDPSFRVRTDAETMQTIISGMGELHLEILVDRLQREFGVEARIGHPQVAYRETIGKRAEAEASVPGSGPARLSVSRPMTK